MQSLRKIEKWADRVVAAVLWPFYWIGELLIPNPVRDLGRVETDDREVRYIRPEGHVDSISWSELQRIAVRTTDGGPYLEDVFYYLAGSECGFYIPLGAAGTDRLSQRLTALPKFNGEEFSSAISCTDNAWFPCWERTLTKL